MENNEYPKGHMYTLEQSAPFVINLNGDVCQMFPKNELINLIWARIGNNNINLMQYTGLKDKNGTEIYEDDILKTVSGKHYWLYKITTSCSQFGNTLFAMCYEHNLSTNEEGEMYTYKVVRLIGQETRRNYIPSGENCEVIGNIHENPELLEVPHE
jgi:uncharacterized phage protein (TIGR01671 family)